MEHRALGRTGLTLSRLGLGCGNFGGIGSSPAHFGGGESEAEAVALLDAAVELGINFLDTADAYGGGRSETWIGRWRAARGAQVLLSTKVFHSVAGDPTDRGLAGDRIRRQIDGSLARLGVERVDMYLIHEPDPQTPLEETLQALDELVRTGKVGAIGASNVDGEWLEDALSIAERERLTPIGWVQNSYSLLDRAAEREVLPLCAERGLGFTPFGPLTGGWLTGKYRRDQRPPAGSRMTLRPGPYEHLDREEVYRGLDAFGEAAGEREVDPATLAIAWVLAHPDVAAVIVGPRNPRQLEPARDALALELSASDRAELTSLFPA
jgi:aryl-alcohol dehydrogenase-like predicted oxidoreductase